MRTYLLSGAELDQLLEGLAGKFGTNYEVIDCLEGCSLDNILVAFVMEGCLPVSIMATEHYCNSWESNYKVTIARTERDNKRLSNMWDKFIEGREAVA